MVVEYGKLCWVQVWGGDREGLTLRSEHHLATKELNLESDVGSCGVPYLEGAREAKGALQQKRHSFGHEDTPILCWVKHFGEPVPETGGPSSGSLFWKTDITRNEGTYQHRATTITGCLRPNPHRTQATSKEKHFNLRARRIARPMWIGPNNGR